jgi:DNA-directed RNA polymerase specialized sigma24 family protein
MRTPKARLAAARAALARAGADQAMSALYEQNYRPLVQLAALLVADPAIAEKIVQDAFVDLHRAGPGTSAALARLRRAVVERSRSAPVTPATTAVPATAPTTVPASGLAAGPSGLVAALRKLPGRQREVLVLHYFADLTEAEIAAATGIGADTVHGHIALAFSLLRAELPAVA